VRVGPASDDVRSTTRMPARGANTTANRTAAHQGRAVASDPDSLNRVVRFPAIASNFRE
jgi:hypothetical protein